MDLPVSAAVAGFRLDGAVLDINVVGQARGNDWRKKTAN
jgi:hypothetical protein